MIDFANIEQYKENNRIEAKKALGGLPHSIWETYSAFANTLGGIILLGVEEYRDKSFHPVNLPDPDKLISEFWNIINDPQKVSANILSHRDVTIEVVDGKHIIAIRVPRAQRSHKPVFIECNPLSGSYRRNGEGDYRCTEDEVRGMFRDAAIKTQDMTVLENMNLDALDYDSVKRYRLCLNGQEWDELGDAEFLFKLGGVGRSGDGKMHPTAAGLLMFGRENEIVKEFPGYSLDYQEQFDSNTCRNHRILSSSGDWSGNIFDFYSLVYQRITQGINVPHLSAERDAIQDSPVHSALREALANCLINGDYYGRGGIVIIKKRDVITLSNPGSFRIDLEAAKSGGVSDPRNSVITGMFNLIGVGEGAGSGIPNIFSLWKKLGWPAPVINESFDPDRITLSLCLGESGYEEPVTESGDGKTAAETAAYSDAILTYLTENVSAGCSELAELIGIDHIRTGHILNRMIEDNILIALDDGNQLIYKLKA